MPSDICRPRRSSSCSLLLENRPRALSKAELHERLWPSTFVSDATLTSLVAEVRAALGETAGHGRFVRTVHRFGYAFKGTATELTPGGPSTRRSRALLDHLGVGPGRADGRGASAGA